VDAPLTLTDVEARADERLDPHWREYFAGGAGDERTLGENVSAFRSWRLRQRVLCGIDSVSTATTLLGRELAVPLVVAPVAYQQMAHPDGEAGMARAAATAGAGLCLSTFSTMSTAEVAAAAPDAHRFLQVYVFRDRGVTAELVAQALDEGFSAVFLTVDLPVLGVRDRERRIHWTFPEESLPAVRYALGRGVKGEGLEILDPTLDWAYLERLCGDLPVPVVVKGVLDPEDARLAADHAGLVAAAGKVLGEHDVAGAEAVHGAVAGFDLRMAGQRDDILAARHVVKIGAMARRRGAEHDAMGRV